MSKSPWSRDFNDLTEPEQSVSLEDRQAEWIRQETSGLLGFLQSERHATLQHVVKTILPRYENDVFAFQLLPVYAVHYDELTHATMMLAQGHLSAEDLVSECLDLAPDDHDLMTFFIPHIDRLVELECAKQAARDGVSFKLLFLEQVNLLVDIHETKIAFEDREGEISDYALQTIKSHLQRRIDTALDFTLPVKQANAIDHWPLVEPLMTFAKELQMLSAQSAAAFAQMDAQASMNSFEDPKLEVAIQFTEATDAVCSYMSNTLLTLIKEELYFLDIGYALGELGSLYGEQGECPDTSWTLDENIALQSAYSILSGRYLRHLQEDGIDEQDPVYFQIMREVIDKLEETIEEKYPVQQDKKPDFIKEKEAAVLETLAREAEEGDNHIRPQSRSREARATPKPL